MKKELEYLNKELDYDELRKFAKKLGIKYFNKSEISGEMVLKESQTNKIVRLNAKNLNDCWFPKYH